MARPIPEARYVEQARNQYVNDDVQIDATGVKVSRAEGGVWVAAWVWVSDEEARK